MLKKKFKKLDHEVKIEDFMGSSDQREKELTSQLHMLKTQLAELKLRLSYWTDPEKAQSIDHIQHMEDTLRACLNHIQIQKARFEKQLMPLGYNGQFQNSIPLPLGMTNDQQSPHLQWIHGCDGHRHMLSEDAYLAQSSAGIALHGYFDTQRPECSRRVPGNVLNDFNQNSYLQLQHGVHNPYLCYDMNFLGEYELNPVGVRESRVDYPLKFYQQANTGYDEIQTWASSLESRGIVKLDEHLYAQTQNPLSADSASSSNMAPW